MNLCRGVFTFELIENVLFHFVDEREKPKRYNSGDRSGEKTPRRDSQASPRELEEGTDSRPSSGEGSRKREKERTEKGKESSELNEGEEVEEGNKSNNARSEEVGDGEEEEEDVGSSVDPVNVREKSTERISEPEEKSQEISTAVSEDVIVEDELSVD